MLDADMQRQIRSLLPKPARKRSAMLPALITTAALTFALTFVLVLYVGQVHKIPINTTLIRLEHMLARCIGMPSAEIRRISDTRPGRRYPSFSMAEQLDAVTLTLDGIETEGCIRDARELRLLPIAQAAKN
jgi:hypothetical protein